MLSALIFDVDGTLAETEELHREAFNEAFAAAALDWHWDQALYGQLLAVSGGKERIAHYQHRAGIAPVLNAAQVAALPRGQDHTLHGKAQRGRYKPASRHSAGFGRSKGGRASASNRHHDKPPERGRVIGCGGPGADV